MSCGNAVTAANGGTDFEESIAYKEDTFGIDLDPDTTERLAAYALLENCDEERLSELEFADHVTEEHVEQFRTAIRTVKDDLGEDDLPEEITFDEFQEMAEECELTDEQLKTLVELETRIRDLTGRQELEKMYIDEASARHKAVAVIIVVVVAVVKVAAGVGMNNL